MFFVFGFGDWNLGAPNCCEKGFNTTVWGTLQKWANEGLGIDMFIRVWVCTMVWGKCQQQVCRWFFHAYGTYLVKTNKIWFENGLFILKTSEFSISTSNGWQCIYIYTYVFCFKYDVHVVWPMWVANVQNVCFMWGVWNAMQQGDNRNLLAKRHGK